MWLDIDPKDHSQNAKKLEDMIINLGKNYGLKELNFKYISHKKWGNKLIYQYYQIYLNMQQT